MSIRDRKQALLGMVGLAFTLFVAPAHAWFVKGKVYCDADQDQSISVGDLPMSGVTVQLVNSASTVFTDVTDADGYYYITPPPQDDTYTAALLASTLPADAAFIHPPGGVYNFELTADNTYTTRNWLIDSEICRTPVVEVNKCWLTGGGVKFSPEAGTSLAEKGPQNNMGGNVFPSCSSEPGYGGQWNHVAHSVKLHFLGTHINEVACGNVDGIEPGSESPVTPYNYIEFRGTGRLSGIKGNKLSMDNVYFFARAEDRNEPGSNGAKDGADIDRYFIHVYSDPGDPVGTTLLLVDEDGSATTVNPVTITGGNLQMHISSCDNPPEQ